MTMKQEPYPHQIEAWGACKMLTQSIPEPGEVSAILKTMKRNGMLSIQEVKLVSALEAKTPWSRNVQDTSIFVHL